ncbi:fimbrial biogenesis chaperone [Alteraurantiacibacter buctensis]|uniref:Fimbria/pilus periplasmic chaperone n=1 Tax=Alteraurantiacibacter buctensis TaxID=1503981 RepID=A0A844YUD8_9SPHN|nr:fimbria/pilus periplasmic chaperone [Alteraurantiacibacter buctensis]MXO70616.1 fimbria/pilus periplasmic chaperone [Alteraurantiacibacter buctensis]
MSASRSLHRVALTLSAWAMLPGIAQAEGLQVAPVSVTIPERSGTVWLTNEGGEALRAQVRVFRWSQDNGEDVLAETTDLVASPPFVSIPAGAQQVVRLVRTAAAADPAAPCEQTFRIVVDELPAAERQAGDGLQYVLRFSVPVYLTTPACAELDPVLTWRIEQGSEGSALVVANTGQVRAQLADLSLVAAGGTRSDLGGGLVGYVLPGQQRHFVLNSAAVSGGTVEVSVNGSRVVAPVALASSGQ